MIMPDDSAPSSSPQLTMPVSERDHALGPADAPLTLLEYGDYECPNCANVFPILKRLIEEMGDQLRFVFRHFPLDRVHPRAAAAAEASEAAAAQGKFWEMHDLLYANQKDLAEIDLGLLALKAGLEIYRFEADISSQRFAKRVREDLESGEASGVKGTPTLFINGEKYAGKKTYEGIREAVGGAG